MTKRFGFHPPVRVLYSYSHKDEDFREQLDEHLALLRREGIISEWDDRVITAGEDWAEKVDWNIARADVILLLVSPSFIASDYCYEREMSLAISRHEAGEAKVIPVLLRPVADWQSAPFGKLQVCPKDGKPISLWKDPDEAYADVAEAVRKAISELGKLTDGDGDDEDEEEEDDDDDDDDDDEDDEEDSPGESSTRREEPSWRPHGPHQLAPGDVPPASLCRSSPVKMSLLR